MNNLRGNNLNRKPKFSVVFLLVMMICLLFYVFFGGSKNISYMRYSDFLKVVEADNVTEVVIIDEKIINAKILATGGVITNVSVNIPYADDNLLNLLTEKGIPVSGKISNDGFWDIIIDFLPMLFMFFILFMIMRQNMSHNEKSMQFGKSRAVLYDKNAEQLTFDSVAGQIEAKKELSEIVDFLKDSKKYIDLGAKIPKGVLLVGGPGTGKTLLARAVAGEANVPFLHVSGSDFVEMFVGVGASRVRDLFEQAKKLAPAIVFIDEIDAVGRSRGSGLGGGHDEREQTLNQMLVEMDGFEGKTGIIVLAATNRPDVLDPALLRPGRFDRQVTVSMPDVKEREAILQVHSKKIKMNDNVDLEKFARATPGMSGADLSNLVNEAALFAARKNLPLVGDEEFEEARDKILMGIARKSMIMPEKEREMTAGHEAGHTLMYYYLKNVSPLHKVTIIPRGRALGLTVGLPKEDSYCHTTSWLKDQLVILFGGYAAETVLYGETTTGTQNDIQRATEIARKMVCEWGMSNDIGAVSYGQEEAPIFMGKEIARHKEFSEYTAQQIDIAVKGILDEAKNTALKLLMENRGQLEKLSSTLVQRETMADEEIRQLLDIVPICESTEK